MLGISLYPDKSERDQDQQYLEAAKQLGYQVVFMSFLQIDLKNPKRSIQRIKESALLARDMGFEVTLDIHPMVFQYLPSKEDDLQYFHDMGIKRLRLDSSFDARTEAMMSRNPYGIIIELNMSNDTQYLNHILDYHPDHRKLCGSHNFYPQRYTGLSKQTFITCSNRFLDAHIPTAAFLTSHEAKHTPWPVAEGLCTLELHRDLPIALQAKHMKMMGCCDTIIIANAYASLVELEKVRDSWEAPVDSLAVEFFKEATELEKALVTEQLHEYRGDTGEYVIRSSKARALYGKESFPAHVAKKAITRGDVLVLNDDFGQYKGELQIALLEREADARVNVVGRIKQEQMILLEELCPFQKFKLMEE